MAIPRHRTGSSGRFWRALADADVDKAFLPAFGLLWPVENFMGEGNTITPRDVGRRVYLVGSALVLETHEQRTRRQTTLVKLEPGRYRLDGTRWVILRFNLVDPPPEDGDPSTHRWLARHAFDGEQWFRTKPEAVAFARARAFE